MRTDGGKLDFAGIFNTTALAVALGFIVSLTGCEDGGGSSHDFGANDPNVVVAVGDSITAGGYPSILGGMTGKSVIDLAHGGTESGTGVGVTGSALPRYHPGYLLILYGANDVIRSISPEVTVGNLRAMVQAAKANMTVPVVATLTPMIEGHQGFEFKVERLNGMIRAMASQEGARLANLFGAFQGHPEYIGPDGLHPNSVGDGVIASVFRSKID